MLQNEYFVAKIGVDTAENELFKIRIRGVTGVARSRAGTMPSWKSVPVPTDAAAAGVSPEPRRATTAPPTGSSIDHGERPQAERSC